MFFGNKCGRNGILPHMDAISLGFRVVSLSGAFIMFATLSSFSVFSFMVFMGHAHFLLAYWYKFEKIPQLVRSPFFFLWVSSVALLLALGIYEVFPPYALFLTAALLFIAHHVYDDLALSIGAVSLPKMLLLFSGVALLYLVEISESVFGILLTNNSLILLAFVAVTTPFFAFRNMGRNTPILFKVYTGLVAGISALAILVSRGIPMHFLLTFFIFTHYFLWYLEYGRRVASNRDKTKKYLFRAVLINILLFVIWYISYSGVQIPFYKYFFTETFFYIWTCLHIIFSFIPGTLGRPG